MISLTYGHASDKVCVSDGTNTLAAAFHPVLPKYVKRGFRASPTLASSMQTPSVCVCMLYILVLVLISVQGNYGSTTIFSLVSSFSE